jgi:hypothetical protein
MSAREKFAAANSKNAANLKLRKIEYLSGVFSDLCAEFSRSLQIALQKQAQGEVINSRCILSTYKYSRDSLALPQDCHQFRNLPGYKALHELCSAPDMDFQVDVRIHMGEERPLTVVVWFDQPYSGSSLTINNLIYPAFPDKTPVQAIPTTATPVDEKDLYTLKNDTAALRPAQPKKPSEGGFNL